MKGGYKIKDGFYIKDECKNSVEEGMVDEEGFILDPILFDKIPKHKLLQLSDGYCYDKSNSQQLLTVINRSNRLPFGHDVKSVDRRELNIKKPKLKKKLLIVESTPSILSDISSLHTPAVIEEPDVIESPAEEFEIIPRRRNRTRRRLPENVIIASDTTEVIDPPIQTLVAQENQNSPVSVRSINIEDEELANLFLTNEEEFYRRMNELGRGIKRKTKKHKNRRGKKSKTKSRKYHK